MGLADLINQINVYKEPITQILRGIATCNLGLPAVGSLYIRDGVYEVVQNILKNEPYLLGTMDTILYGSLKDLIRKRNYNRKLD